MEFTSTLFLRAKFSFVKLFFAKKSSNNYKDVAIDLICLLVSEPELVVIL